MKKHLFLINATAFVLSWMALPLLLACDPGCEEHYGVCACDQKPVADTTPPIQPSDEEPPKDKMPSYQREGVKADMPESLSAQDAKADMERAQADSEGKKAAGL